MDTQLSYAEQSLTNEQLVERYIAFKEKQKYYDEELKLMREALLNTYPTGNTLEGPFIVAISKFPRTSLDQSAVKNVFPEVYKQCTKTADVTKLECIRVEE